MVGQRFLSPAQTRMSVPPGWTECPVQNAGLNRFEECAVDTWRAPSLSKRFRLTTVTFPIREGTGRHSPRAPPPVGLGPKAESEPPLEPGTPGTNVSKHPS